MTIKVSDILRIDEISLKAEMKRLIVLDRLFANPAFAQETALTNYTAARGRGNQLIVR